MTKRTVYTPIGSLLLTEDAGHLVQLDWDCEHFEAHTPLLSQGDEELQAYLRGDLKDFQVPYKFSKGTPFEQKVWSAISKIPYGETSTYGDLAKDLGSSPRAIGTACGKNPLPLIVPCHRVVGKNGEITGYSGGDGPLTKEKLLDFEKQKSPRTSITPVFDSLRRQLPQKPFYFMRHGQTDYNQEGVLQGGGLNPVLNAQGRQQAREASKVFEGNSPPGIVWHSHLTRAEETAKIMTKTLTHASLLRRTHQGIGERFFGISEGKKKLERQLLRDVWQTEPEGESWLAFTTRIGETLEEILSESQELPLLVAHGGVGNCLGELLGFQPRDNFMNNCQIWYISPGNTPLASWQAEMIYIGEK